MDVITIIIVTSSIVGILGFLYAVVIGQKPIADWWKGQVQKKPAPSKPPELPQLPLHTAAAHASRKLHLGLARKYIETRKEEKTRDLLEPLVEGGSLFDPAITLPSDSDFVDCICSIVTRAGKTTAILPSGQSDPDIEGVGRTSILLRLLGLAIPYGRMLGLDIQSFPGDIPIFRRSESPYRLLASDIAYIGNPGGIFSVVPTKGELVSFIWDIARNIFRSTALDYQTGDHRRPSEREKLYQIFYRIPIGELSNLFGKLDSLYPLDEIIILRRKIQAPFPISSRVVIGSERERQLRDAMLVSLRHGSDFWKRNLEALTRKVTAILDGLNWSRVGPIIEIIISHPSPIIPNHVYDEIADGICTGELPSRYNGPANITVGNGVRYHNDVLYRSIYDTHTIWILVTSGEYLFKDMSFWKILSQVKTKLYLKVLMLDPDSQAAAERMRMAYADKESGFLQREIRENIETIRRMSKYFRQAGIPVHICCKLYSELPAFRMTFIGMKRLLVAAYSKKERTGYSTLFYDIQADLQGDLFMGFVEEFEQIAGTSREIQV